MQKHLQKNLKTKNCPYFQCYLEVIRFLVQIIVLFKILIVYYSMNNSHMCSERDFLSETLITNFAFKMTRAATFVFQVFLQIESVFVFFTAFRSRAIKHSDSGT